MLAVNLAQDDLRQRVTCFVILHRKLAAKARDDERRRAFDCDKYMVVQIAAGDSVHHTTCERRRNIVKRQTSQLLNRPYLLAVGIIYECDPKSVQCARVVV